MHDSLIEHGVVYYFNCLCDCNHKGSYMTLDVFSLFASLESRPVYIRSSHVTRSLNSPHEPMRQPAFLGLKNQTFILSLNE